MSKPRIIKGDGIVIECRTDETLAPSVLRVFAGATPLDRDVDSLEIPDRPIWLRNASAPYVGIGLESAPGWDSAASSSPVARATPSSRSGEGD
jgi:hypothetical protein